MKRLTWFTALILLLAAPLAAQASHGYVTANLNLRAGPNAGYPLITTIPYGTSVSVQGCTTDWAWCDVIAYGNRGWVNGYYINYPYRGQRVVLPSYGARIGIPIISFSIGTYWGRHYRHRPFYRHRGYWRHHRFGYRHPYRGHRWHRVHRRHHGHRVSYGHRWHNEHRGHQRHRWNQHHRGQHRGRGHGGGRHHGH